MIINLGRKLLTGGALRGFAVILSAIIGLFTMPILVHSLGTRYYGFWVLSTTLVFYCDLTDVGLSMAVTQSFSFAYGAKDKERMNIIIITSIVLYSLLSCIAILASFGVAYSSAYWLNSADEKYILFYTIILLGLTFATQFPARAISAILYSQVRHDLLMAGTITANIVRMGLIVYAVTHGYNLIALALITLIVGSLENIWQIACAIKIYPELLFKRKYFRLDCARSLLIYSSAFFVSNMANMFKLQSLPLLVTKFISVEAVALFAIAQRFLGYCSQLAKSVSDMLCSVFSQLHSGGNKSKLYEAFLIATSLATICSGYILLDVILYGKSFIQSWMGLDYLEAAILMNMLVIPVCIEIVMNPGKELLYGIAKIRGLIFLHSLELALVLILSSILGYFYGLMGIAMGFVIGIAPLELIVLPYLVISYFELKKVDFIKPILSVVIKWGFFATILYLVFHSRVEPTFLSLIVCNVIQLIIALPMMFYSLPKFVRVKLVAILFTKRQLTYA